jgi:uncharacterized circularly permuted ATP-grasp superfamily protein
MAAPIFNEMCHDSGLPRAHYEAFDAWLKSCPEEMVHLKQTEADLISRRTGITFSLNGDEDGTERLIPSDLIPRIIDAQEWAQLETGLVQRVKAINLFLHDVYHQQNILKAGLIPADQVLANAQFLPMMLGLDLPHQTYAHIAGVDIVRHSDGGFYVLEDNLRVPSGVSYMLSNRILMMRLFPDLFRRYAVRPVEHYPALLLQTLRAASWVEQPTVVLHTPGRFNSAYFEHAFLAKQMGIELVEGTDMFVRDGHVFMQTTEGPQQVDVIYRRVDDNYMDPLSFEPDSFIGVPGLASVYRQGHVVIANALGTGVADDKSIYPYVPEMVRFYLGEEPILKNVQTWQCRHADELSYVLANLKDLVVKEVHGAGGYGMLVGPASSKNEIDAFAKRIKAHPDNYIAQPTLSLSSCPIFVDQGIAPRHIDLRPFVLMGDKTRIVPGGLTRVALREGSLVVNSSQGGGTKDTWVLEESEAN